MFFKIRRIGKNDVVVQGAGELCQKMESVQAVNLPLEGGLAKIALGAGAGRAVGVHKIAGSRTATESLDAEGTTSAKKVQAVSARHEVSKAGENGSANAVHGGTDIVGRCLEMDTSGTAGYDSHGDWLIFLFTGQSKNILEDIADLSTDFDPGEFVEKVRFWI